MRKRWIASALGKFVYKLRNATKGITRICKVNNGAVAVCNGANGCFATVLHPLSFAQKKKASEFRCFLFWWEEVDSNHRRRCQQIYSLLPLATRESSHAWSWWSESNQQPADYKSAALPLSHTSVRCPLVSSNKGSIAYILLFVNCFFGKSKKYFFQNQGGGGK